MVKKLKGAKSRKEQYEKRKHNGEGGVKTRHTIYAYRKRRIRKLRVALALLILAATIMICAFPKQSVQYAKNSYLALREKAEGILNSSRIIATVNGEPITLGEFNRQLRIMLFLNGVPQSYEGSVDKKAFLDQVITRKLLLQQARKNGIYSSYNEGAQLLKEAINRSGLTEELIRSIMDSRRISEKELAHYYAEEISIIRFVNESIEPKVSVTEQDIINFYNETRERYTAPQGSIRLRLIALNSSEKAEQVYLMLKNNSSNFATFARYESIDRTAAYGGDLGFIKKTTLPAEISKEVLPLRVGEITAPILYNNTYYIFKREADTIPYEEIKDQLEQGLKNSIRNTLVLQLIEELKSKANIKVYDPIFTPRQNDTGR